MGFLTRALRPKVARAVTMPAGLSFAAWATAAGIDVTPETAITFSAVFQAIRVLAEGVAMLPLPVYERLAGGDKQRAIKHPLYGVLHDSPNPEMTSFEWREVSMGHLASWGNAYSEIVRDNGGRVRELWPLRPDMMRVERKEGRLIYHYRVKAGDAEKPLAAERVLHLRGLGGDGVMGYSPIRLARQSIGLGLAAEEFGARFFSNGARPGGVLEYPGELDDVGYERLKKSWDDTYGGLKASHRIAILEQGLSYKQIGIPPEDAQFLETRKFQVTDVARWFNVQPHRLMDLERSTFSNIEQQSLEFVIYTLQPWLTRWEQRLGLQLLTPAERQRYYAEFLVEGLLRGDVKSRYEAYAVGRQNGWLSANDIRRLENMNAVEGGEVYLVPLNMVPADRMIAGGMDAAGSGEQGSRAAGEQGRKEERARRSGMIRHRLAGNFAGMFVDALGRVLRRESNDVGNSANKFLGRGDVVGFNEWLLRFYENHKAFVVTQMEPVAQTYAAQIAQEAGDEVGNELPEANRQRFVGAYLNTFAARHVARQTAKVQAAVNEGGLETLGTELDGWRDEGRAADEAQEETTRLNNAVAVAVYVAAGILTKRWLSFGDSCPYCTALNGREVGLNFQFIAAGESFLPDGAAQALIPSYGVGHPPAHRGCDCMVVAG